MSCQKWERMLIPYVSGDLPVPDRERLEAHLDACPSCRRELALCRAIVDAAGAIGEAAGSAAKQVAWPELEQVIRQAVPEGRLARWLPAATRVAMAACLLLVAGIVWMWAPARRPVKPHGGFQVDQRTLHRMELDLARQEVADYLKKSRLVLAELMTQCATKRSQATWKPDPAIRKLLVEKRMFSDELERLPLRHARSVCRRLDMVFASLAGLDRSRSCVEVNQLKRLVHQDQLLLKIRLVEQELKGSEG